MANQSLAPVPLTSKILRLLSKSPNTIIYAEFAEGGAMGCPGTARFYSLEDGVLHFYLVDTIAHPSATNLKAYSEALSLFQKLADRPEFNYVDAHYGNHVLKSAKATFTRDDDSCEFIFKYHRKHHRITPSCNGVYYHAAKAFAPHTASSASLERFLEQYGSRINIDEAYFIKAYSDALSTLDDNYGHLPISVREYQDALNVAAYYRGEAFNFADDAIIAGIRALNKYRLRYAIGHLGWRETTKFINTFIKNPADHSLFPALATALKLDFDFGTLFYQTPHITIDCTNLDKANDNNLTSYFYYPILAELSEADRHSIHRQILEMSSDRLADCAQSIAYYLTNYIWHENIWPLADVLPVCFHLIEHLPFKDNAHTETAAAFYMAGEIIDTAWRYIPENETIQRKFRDMVYQAYWPRIGSTWPLRHWGEFEFTDPAATEMMEDSLGFVMSLKDLTNRNRELKAFFAEMSPAHPHPQYHIERRAFSETLKTLSSHDQLEHILAWRDPSDYHFFLSYPENIEDADNLLTELFRTDKNTRITGLTRIGLFEKLLLTPNSLGVGEHILKYLNSHFAKFEKLITADVKTAKLDVTPISIMTDIFTALYAGVSEENEFPPMKALGDKLIAAGANEDTIKATIKLAREHRRTIAFQRASLQKLF